MQKPIRLGLICRTKSDLSDTRAADPVDWANLSNRRRLLAEGAAHGATGRCYDAGPFAVAARMDADCQR